MASTAGSFYKISTVVPFPTSKLQKYHPIRSQRFRDEGKSAKNNIVDANMTVLRKRIEVERMKERLKLNNTRTLNDNNNIKGWKYEARYDDTCKRRAFFAEYFEIAASVGRTFGLVFLSGSLFVLLYSLLLHLHMIHYSSR